MWNIIVAFFHSLILHLFLVLVLVASSWESLSLILTNFSQQIFVQNELKEVPKNRNLIVNETEILEELERLRLENEIKQTAQQDQATRLQDKKFQYEQLSTEKQYYLEQLRQQQQEKQQQLKELTQIKLEELEKLKILQQEKIILKETLESK